MKRTVRIIALIACAAILCMSLCSCEALDEAKRATAYFTDDTRQALTFHGKTYTRIETPTTGLHFIMNDTERGYRAVTPDIPVLLAANYGTAMLFQRSDNESPKVVAVANNSYYYNYNVEYRESVYSFRDNKTYYLKDETAAEVKDLLDNAVCDHFCVFVYDYETGETDEYGEPETINCNVMIDDDATAAVNRAIAAKKQIKWSSLNPSDGWYYIDLVCCDSSMLVTDSKIYKILTNDSQFYLYEDALYYDSPLYEFVDDNDLRAISKVYDLCSYYMYTEYLDGYISREKYHETQG